MLILPNHHRIRGVDCYGDWREDSNCAILGYDEFGNELEEMYADGASSWEDAVDKILKWADDAGVTVLELQEC